MMLPESTTSLVCSQPFAETEFSIGDPVLIMEYLRKNAYSNPKRAICQEIMCNARDAHREIAMEAMPIVVKLPTRMQPNWSCRDFGPGISPTRMDAIFTKFGKSTKRGDNTQCGGFGIGSKTPFSYTDTFLINTICNIEGHLIEYNYAAVIGANRIPKLVQMADPVASKEKHTGTTISFTVEAKDQSDFARHSYDVSRFWTVRPEITGNDDYSSAWNVGTYKFRNDAWGILESRHNGTLIIIDGIPYTLNIDSLGGAITAEERSLISYNTCNLFFNVGELSVSLNREALYYDDRTIKLIMARIREMVLSLRQHYEDMVANSKTLWDAAIALAAGCGFFQGCQGFLNGIKWNGKVIPNTAIYGSSIAEVIHYKRESANSYKYANKVRRLTSDARIHFSPNSKLVFGDSKTKIEYLFNNDKTLVNVYSFRQKVGGTSYDPIWDKWLKDTNVMELSPTKVEDLPVAPRIPRAKNTNPHRSVKTYVWKNGDWYDTEISSEVLENGKGIYVPCFRRRPQYDNTCEREISTDDFRIGDILNYFTDKKMVVYGIQKDLLPDLGSGWVSLYDHVRNTIKDMAKDHKLAVGVIVDYLIGDNDNRSTHYTKLGDLITKNLDKMPECVVEWHKATETLNKIKSLPGFLLAPWSNHRIHGFLKLEAMDKKHVTIEALKEKVFNECKLLNHIPFNNYGYDASREDHIVLYLNSIKELQLPKKLVA